MSDTFHLLPFLGQQPTNIMAKKAMKKAAAEAPAPKKAMKAMKAKKA